MQSKLILSLALTCLSAFVAASPIPAPAPAAVAAVHDNVLPRVESLAREEPNLAREEIDVEEREPTCRYDCI
ncbi:hypothetical protein EV361DRAFT_949543 [Lentinula raphanica]|nr:hypothetical protein EV360DRAFT_82801 [Lentinula raphanica]KAJ3820069.1 hypothetical protein F5880DRAFT_1615898 [Lentinula raphanica]KAJ3971614.1 hypothetical protein EV361DRAFT_949543 [Lentinula raphanica]